MSDEEKTPTHRILSSLWNKATRRKRSPPTPSTGDSMEGGVSKIQKMDTESEDLDSSEIKKDLLEEFDREWDNAAAEMVVDGLEKQMDKNFREFKEQMRQSVKKVLRAMNEKINTMCLRVDNFLAEAKKKTGKDTDSKELQKMKIEINRLGQYTRKDSCRMFGVKECEGEDCRAVVCAEIQGRLGVNIVPSDIVVAHRLPKTKKQKYRPIIVKFRDRELKWDILRVRKKLKGSGVSIAEDMTKENFDLMLRAQDSGYFTSVWFSNAKVWAVDKANKKHVLDLFDDFAEITG